MTPKAEDDVTPDVQKYLLEKAKPLWWYHRFILPDGTRTSGWKTSNATVTRAAFKGLDLNGKNCVDLGAMDGQYSVLMKQMGAKNVTAFDRKDRSEQIGIVRELSGKKFQYVPEVEMVDVRHHIRRRWGQLADFVNFAGILYHMFDVLSGIGIVRGMVKRGGLVVLDTPAIVSEDSIMYYNWDEQFYGPGTYIVPSVFCLEEMCKFLGFEIVDAFYGNQSRLLKMPQVRISLVLRAATIPAIAKSREKAAWAADYILDDLLELMDYESVFSDTDAAVRYSASGPFEAYRGSQKALFRFCTEHSDLPFNEEDTYLKL